MGNSGRGKMMASVGIIKAVEDLNCTLKEINETLDAALTQMSLFQHGVKKENDRNERKNSDRIEDNRRATKFWDGAKGVHRRIVESSDKPNGNLFP